MAKQQKIDHLSKSEGSGTDPSQAAGRFVSHLGPLFILTAIFSVNFISRIILAPLSPEIERSYNLSHADAGALFFLISLGYFISLTTSGFVSARLSHKRAIIVSNTVLGIALIGTAFSKNAWSLSLGLFTIGIATGLYLPSAISTLTDLVSSRHWGKALAIHEMAPNLGFVVAPLVAELAMIRFSWKLLFIFFGVAALCLNPLFARFGRGGAFMGQAPGLLLLRELFARSSFWVMAFLFSLAICGSLGIYTMLPLYLVTERGMDRNLANTLIGLSRISGLVVSFVGGWAADRFGPKRTLKSVLLVTGMMTLLLGIGPRKYVHILVFLQPLVAVCFFPAGFTAVSFIFPPRLRNLAVSFIVPVAVLAGGGIVPIFIGLVGDISSFAFGIAVTGALITAGSIVAGMLKYHHPRS